MPQLLFGNHIREAYHILRERPKYRWRTWLRGHTPDFLYDRGFVIDKGKDCRPGPHGLYRQDDKTMACYHCKQTVPTRRA